MRGGLTEAVLQLARAVNNNNGGSNGSASGLGGLAGIGGDGSASGQMAMLSAITNVVKAIDNATKTLYKFDEVIQVQTYIPNINLPGGGGGSALAPNYQKVTQEATAAAKAAVKFGESVEIPEGAYGTVVEYLTALGYTSTVAQQAASSVQVLYEHLGLDWSTSLGQVMNAYGATASNIVANTGNNLSGVIAEAEYATQSIANSNAELEVTDGALKGIASTVAGIASYVAGITGAMAGMASIGNIGNSVVGSASGATYGDTASNKYTAANGSEWEMDYENGVYTSSSGAVLRMDASGNGTLTYKGREYVIENGKPIKTAVGYKETWEDGMSEFGKIVGKANLDFYTLIFGAAGLKELGTAAFSGLSGIDANWILKSLGVTGAATGAKALSSIFRNFMGFAEGGIIGSEQLVRVGEGNRKEAIVPLETSKGIGMLASALEQAGANTGEVNVHVTLSGQILEMNDYNVKKLGDKLASVINNQAIRRGGI